MSKSRFERCLKKCFVFLLYIYLYSLLKDSGCIEWNTLINIVIHNVRTSTVNDFILT